MLAAWSGTISVIRLTHPVTGRFVGEFDPVRGLLMVVDRGHDGIIDLLREAQKGASLSEHLEGDQPGAGS